MGIRVLHVTDTYLPRRGGIELHVHDLAQAQRLAGYDVDVLTVTRGRPSGDAPSGGTLTRPGDGAGWLTKARFIASQRRMGELDGYDVVHGHCSTMSPLVFATAAAAQMPTAVTVHSLWRRYLPLYRAADHVFGWSQWPVAWSAVSQAAADAVRRASRRSLTIDVVPNGIDLPWWQQQQATGQRVPGVLRVTSVMRLAPRKRPIALLRILRAAAKEMPANVRLEAVVIGDGPEAPAMRRVIARHDLDDVVQLSGHVPRHEIAQRLADTDVFVAPATLESFGIAALEAAAMGVPVLGRRGTGLAEFVGTSCGGLLVDSDREIAAALVDFASDSRIFAPAAVETLEGMSWPSVVAQTAELYERAGLRSPVTAPVTRRRIAS